jgi:hypothetical protein
LVLLTLFSTQILRGLASTTFLGRRRMGSFLVDGRNKESKSEGGSSLGRMEIGRDNVGNLNS